MVGVQQQKSSGVDARVSTPSSDTDSLNDVSGPRASQARAQLRSSIHDKAQAPTQSSGITDASIETSLSALTQQQAQFHKRVLTPAQSLVEGAQSNVETGRREVAESGIVDRLLGHRAALEEGLAISERDVSNQTAHAEKLKARYEASLESKRAAEEMLVTAKRVADQGFTEEAAAMRLGASKLISQANDSLKGLKAIDPQHVAETVAGMRELQKRLDGVIQRAEYGQTAASIVKETAHVAGIGVGFALGGPAGGAAVNQGLRMIEGAAEEGMHVVLGNKTRKEAGSEFLKRSQDALVESAITGASGAVGQRVGAFAAKLHGPVVAKTVDILSSGTIQSAGTGVQIGYEFGKAHQEFEKNNPALEGPARERAYTEFMNSHGFSLEEVCKRLGASFAAGAAAKGVFHVVAQGAAPSQGVRVTLANSAENTTSNVGEVTVQGGPITLETVVPALLGGHIVQSGVRQAQGGSSNVQDRTAVNSARTPQQLAVHMSHEVSVNGVQGAIRFSPQQSSNSVEAMSPTGESGGGPTTSAGARTSTGSMPSNGLQHLSATSTQNPALTVSAQAAELRRAVESAARTARIDVVHRSRSQIERYEQEHAQRLDDLFPIHQSQQQMVEELTSAFARIRKAADLPEDVSLHTFGAGLVNAYVIPAYDQQSNSNGRSKDQETDYANRPGGKKVFLSLGLVYDLQKHLEEQAARSLDNTLTSRGVEPEHAASIVEAVRTNRSPNLQLSPDQHGIVDASVRAFERARHITVDDIAAVIAHECQHLRQSNELLDQGSLERTAHKHQLEWDADGGGMMIHAKAGFNPRAWERVTGFLASEGGVLASNSHPSGESRQRFIQQLIADPDRPLAGLARNATPLSVAAESSLRGTERELLQESRDRNELALKVSSAFPHPAFYQTLKNELHEVKLFERISDAVQSPEGARLWGRVLLDIGVLNKDAHQKSDEHLQRSQGEIAAKRAEIEQAQSAAATDPHAIAYLRGELSGLEGGFRLAEAKNKRIAQGDLSSQEGYYSLKQDVHACVSCPAHRELWHSWRDKVPPGCGQQDVASLDNIRGNNTNNARPKQLQPADFQAMADYFDKPTAPLTLAPELKDLVDRARLVLGVEREKLSIAGETPSMERVKHGMLYAVACNSNNSVFRSSSPEPLMDGMTAVERNLPLTQSAKYAQLSSEAKELAREFTVTGLCEAVSDDLKERLYAHPQKGDIAVAVVELVAESVVPKSLTEREGAFSRHFDSRSVSQALEPLSGILYRDKLPSHSLDVAILRVGERLESALFSYEAITVAKLQQPPDKAAITAENVAPALTTLLSHTRYADAASVVKEVLPNLPLPDHEKAELRRLTVKHLHQSWVRNATAGEALASLYGVALTANAVAPTEASSLVTNLIQDGVTLPSRYSNSTTPSVSDPLLSESHPLWSQSPEIQQRLALARFEPGSELKTQEIEKLARLFQTAPSEMLASLPQFDLVAEKTAYDSVGSWGSKPGISLSIQELQSYHQELRAMRERRPEAFLSQPLGTQPMFQQEQQIGLEMLRRGVVALDPKTEGVIASRTGEDLLGKGAVLKSEPLPSMTSVATTPLPKLLQDWWQIADWKKRGSPATEFASLAAAIDRTQGATADVHSLDAVDLLIYAKNSNLQGGPNSPEAVQAVQYYQQNKNTFPPLEDTLLIFASSPYMTLQASRYSASPDSLVHSSLPFEQRVSALSADLDRGALRDHLLMRELSRELCGNTGESFSTTVAPVTFSGSRSGQNFIFDICNAEGFSRPTLGRLKGCNHDEVLGKVKRIYDLLHSSSDKATVARIALEAFPSDSAHERFERITQFLPEPSPLRDHFLKRLVAEYPATLEQIETFRSALTSESLMKNGTVKATAASQIVTMVGSLSGEHRQEVAEWLCGMKNDAPWYLQAAAGEHGFSIENQPKLFAALTPDERTAALRALLLDQSEKTLGAQDSGTTFRATTLEEKQRLNQFVGNFVDKVIDSNDPAYEHIKMTAELLFEHARPERRLHYFDALSRAYLQTQSGADPIARGEIVALFLEQTGPLGCKLMQMLSHDKNLPDDLREAFGDRRSGVSPFSEFAVASRVRDTHDAGHSALTIEKRLGTASMKQAHRVSYEGEHAVLKVLRPTVEKYSEEDFALCEIVIESLRKSGTPIPKHLIASLQEVVREESDLENEARLQRDLKAQVTGQTYNELSLAVPAVKEVRKDWALEELASGKPLAKSANTSKEYQEASLAAGSSLLNGILAKKLYHADLHDENIFLDTQRKTLTFIDCGAVGQATDETLAFLRAFIKKDARSIVEILSRDNGSANDLTSDHAKASLEATLKRDIFAGRVSLEERANRLSYTILDSVVPSREIRYLIKALGVGGHHLESLVPSVQDIASPRRLFEKSRVLFSAWRAFR